MKKYQMPMLWRKPKKKVMRFVGVIFILILVALILPTTTWAGNILHFSGNSADAPFLNVNPPGCDCNVNPGCIFTDVSVFATDNKSQNPPGPGNSSSQAVVQIFQFDCTATTLVDAFCCAGLFCSVPLADQGFQVSHNLDSATLNATLGCVDFVSGLSFNVDVNLDWTGTSDLSRSNSHFHNSFPSCTINFHSNGTSRPAQASGTISDGTTNFAPDPTEFAEILSAKNGEIDIGCQ